jgi:propionyl-CoA carboxylase alpha chain
MNTRLQVEHPVTELVTGIDLVEQMIRSAAGEKLTLRQQDINLSGAAIETRIYAEDPFRNFLPSTGRLITYRPPGETSAAGVTVRNDTGVYEGGEISLWYDPLIAKLITHAPTRAQAIDAQAHALDAFAIDGIRHNIPFLSALMQHERFRAGRLSTGFIAEEYPRGFAPHPAEGDAAQVLAAVATAIDHVVGERKRRISGQMMGRTVTRASRRAVWLDTDEHRLEVTREDDGIKVRFFDADDRESRVVTLRSAWKPGEPVWEGMIDGRPAAVQVRRIANGFDLAYRGVRTKAFVYTEREAAAARLMPVKTAADSGRTVRCPMPGLVVSIAVSEGQEVKAGETLAVVEAMKMENVLRAERDGAVKKVHAKAGDSLAVDAVILEFA